MRAAIVIAVSLAAACANPAAAQQQPKEDLASIDKRIASAPDDPMLRLSRAQRLAEAGKYDDAYQAAHTAMQKFVLADKDLAWLMLESFFVDGRGVTVHFNMGPDERKPPADGIARPLTFRIYNKAGTSIVETFDFEIGYTQGKPQTGAFGKTTDEGHLYYAPVAPDSPYSKIRAKAIARIKKLPADDEKP